ncbi:hypothetical protein ACF6ZU_22160 [Pseudomonas migulae]|jgi:hypothetical protein|uniref:hypothetical protein n=1 Tax=Pseudomonas migulae TaxID=78543 RepID=UPI00371562DE
MQSSESILGCEPGSIVKLRAATAFVQVFRFPAPSKKAVAGRVHKLDRLLQLLSFAFSARTKNNIRRERKEALNEWNHR